MGHAGKCTTLPVARSRKGLPQPQYQLHGHILQTVNSVNYLGLCFTEDLSWNEHINNVCSKANKTLGFLRRNLKISSRGIKETAYKTLVQLIMEYEATVWDPLPQENIDNMEAVQRRAARFVLGRYRNTSSVSNMIDELRWPSLQDRRRTARLTMLYQIRHEMVCMNNMTEKLQPAVARQRRGHTYRYVQPRCAHNTNNSCFYHEQSETGTTYPRALWRRQPSTLSCQGPPNWLNMFFFVQCRPPKSDRIISLLTAVASTKEKEERISGNDSTFSVDFC